MARTTGGDGTGTSRATGRPRPESKDPIAQTLHHLSNNLHSLTLRLFVLQNSSLSTEARAHIDAAHRLAVQSVTLIEQIHTLVDVPPPKPRRPSTPRRPR